MSIKNGFIEGLPHARLLHAGVPQIPTLLVIHYSVTNTVADAVSALNQRRLGYHILIEKDGKAFQTRPFTEHAPHPGRSNWKAEHGVSLTSSIDRQSIGICLMNMGFAVGANQSKAPGKLIYNPDDPSMQHWETYPPPQIDRCKKIVADIVRTYPITEVVGHHDVAIMGKFDPGPLFDFNALNTLINVQKPLGHETVVKERSGLELRAGPRRTAPSLRNLSQGTPIFIRSIAYGTRAECIQPAAPKGARYLTPWASVDIGGTNQHAGFVHMSGLKSTPLTSALAAHL